MFNEYELTVIIRPDLDDPATYGLIEKLEGVIQDGEGTLLDRDDWGKRKLAYAIDRHLKGHYVLLDFASGPGLVYELERRMRNEDAILRFLTVRVEELEEGQSAMLQKRDRDDRGDRGDRFDRPGGGDRFDRGPRRDRPRRDDEAAPETTGAEA